MDLVEQWIGNVAGAEASGEVALAVLALHHSKAWDALAEGALGDLAYDAARRMGARGWSWIERPGGRAEPRRMALRAVCMGDAIELARWLARLNSTEALRALSVAEADSRIDGDQWWECAARSWPLALGLDAIGRQAPNSWSEVSRLLSLCGPEQSSRAAEVFSTLLGTPDAGLESEPLAAWWVLACCDVGASVEHCAMALSKEAKNKGSKARSWALRARWALARGASRFGKAQEDPRTACSSGSYWNAWKLLGVDGDPGVWDQWLAEYWKALRVQSVAGRRMASCATLWESLDALAQECNSWRGGPCTMSTVIGLARMHMEAWAPTPGEAPSMQSSYYRGKIEEAVLAWAWHLGESEEGWSKTLRELSTMDPALAARFEHSMLVREMNIEVVQGVGAVRAFRESGRL